MTTARKETKRDTKKDVGVSTGVSTPQEPVPFFNKPYEPNDLDFLGKEIGILKLDPILTPIDHNRFWEYGKVLAFCRRYLETPAEILDVGGAHSTLAPAISTLGHSVMVADIDPTGADFLHGFRGAGYRRLSWVACAAESLRGRDAAFDCVMAISTIEHLPDDGPALLEFVRVLRPGGYLVLTFDFVKEERLPTVHQVRFYTQEDLRTMVSWLAGRGLEPIEPCDYSYAGEHIACYGDEASVYNGAMLVCRKA